MKEQRFEERLLNDSLWHCERPVIESFLKQIRAATRDADYFGYQSRLLGWMQARQQTITALRGARAELKLKLRSAVRCDPKPLSAIRDLQRQIAENERVESVHLSVYGLLRVLGDELAWRRLGANRAAVTVLGQGAPVAWLSSGTGWASELAAIHQLWVKDDVLALAHDATTCLRLGDITCFFPDRTEVQEVKASKVADDQSVQMRRLHDATELITAGRATIDGVPHAVLTAPTNYETHLGELPGALGGARRDGRSVVRLSNSHLLVAHDLRLPAAEKLGPFDEAHAREAASWGRDDVLIHFGTSLRRMRDRHHNFPYFAPLSLLPLDVEDVVDVLFGSLDYTTWINVSAVARYLAGRGRRVVPHTMPEAADVFVTASERRGRTRDSVRVAPHLREMMSIELMTTPTLANLVDHMFDELRRDPSLCDSRPMVVAATERDAWQLG